MTAESSAPGASADGDRRDPDTPRLTFRVLLFDYLRLFGLAGLALLSPLLDSLKKGPTFFIAQGMDRGAIVLFLLFWALVPPFVALIPVAIARLVAPKVGEWVMAAISGVLFGLAALGLVSGSHTWRALVFIAVLAGLAVAFAFLFERFRNLRTFVSALAFAPLLVIVGFVSAPGVDDIVFPDAGATGSVTRNDTPVAMVIFDELSLGVLLRPDGTIDEANYPNFARLAQSSTWYPDARSVAPWTDLAVPAIDTGLLPDPAKTPSASSWPRSVFSMVGASGGDVVAHESTTALCPEDICGATTRLSWRQVISDSWSVAGNSVLSKGLAGRWFSELGDTWAGFDDSSQDLSELEDVPAADFHDMWQQENQGSDDPPVAMEQFISELPQVGAGDLGYVHFHLPHWPFQFLPDGTVYNGPKPPFWFDASFLGTDPFGQVTVRQREVLQTMYADHVLGRVLDAIEAQSSLDDAMVVVTADHGISLDPAVQRRGARDITENTIDDTMAVPLFVRYPGQEQGAVDRRDARTIDILPTIAEVTDAELSDDWTMDGTSLQADPVEGRPRWWVSKTSDLVDSDPQAERTAQRYWTILGSRAMSGEPFAIGPYADLIGVEGDDLPTGAPSTAACGYVHEDWASYDPAASPYPALVSAKVDLPSGTWVVGIVNGRVSGMGPTYVDPRGMARVDVMVEQGAVHAGANQVELAVVGSDGSASALTCS